MPCLIHKDESKLVAKTRIAPLGLKHCVYVYLWPDAETMGKATGEYGCDACTCNMPWISGVLYQPWQHWLRVLTFGVVDLGVSILKFPKKIAEMHFVAGNWDEEAVSHEATHATISLARACQLSTRALFDGQHGMSEGCYEVVAPRQDLQHITCDEEFFCYVQGELTHAVYRWLWRNNPSENWVRVAE